MESCTETRTDINSKKAVELKSIKEEIKRAKDEAMQSWLDSRPLIDELEKLQSGLEIAKNRSAKSKIIISDLESQLESTYMIIRSKKEEEIKIRTTINRSSQELGKIHENMDRLKIETDEEKRSRLKLKQVLRLRKQRLRTLQLTLRAIRLESDAFGASADEAVRYISGMDDNATVELSQEEYSAMKRRAKEETSLADWRVSVAMEQMAAAERGRDSALRRLEELYSDKKSRKREIEEEIKPAKQGLVLRDENEDEDEDMGKRVEGEVKKRENGFPKARAKLMAESGGDGAIITREKLRRRRRRNTSNSEKVVKKNKKMKKKKRSVVLLFKNCFVGKMTRWFG